MNATEETLERVRVLLAAGALSDPSTPVASGAVTSKIILGAAGTLRSCSAQIDDSVSTGDVWLLVLNANALPADGVVTSSVLASVKVKHVSGIVETVSIDEVPAGIDCSTGAVVVASSTGWSAGACTLTKITNGLATVNARVAP